MLKLKHNFKLTSLWSVWLLVGLYSTLWGQQPQELKPLFENAYKTYSQLPEGLLESISFHNTRFTHINEDGLTGEHHHEMPEIYGVMGLYASSSNGFISTLDSASKYSGISVETLKKSTEHNIMGAAAYLNKIAHSKGIHNDIISHKNLSFYREVIEEFSGVPSTDEMSSFIRQEYTYRILLSVSSGIKLGDTFIQNKVEMSKAFNAKELNVLESNKVSINLSSGRVEAVDYPSAEWIPSLNYSSRGNTRITDVAIHVAQGSFTSALNTLRNTTAANPVSSHYLVGSGGRVVQLVRESDRAWHIGNANSYTVGIEHEGFVAQPSYFTEDMYNASTSLTKDICNRNNIAKTSCYKGTQNSALADSYNYHIKGHVHFPVTVNSNGHTDPGVNWQWQKYYDLLNGNVCPGTTLQLTASRMQAASGSTTEMINGQGYTLTFSIKNISTCVITRFVGAVPVDQNGTHYGVLQGGQTQTWQPGETKTISITGTIQGSLGNWNMYFLANPSQNDMEASLSSGAANFRHRIGTNSTSVLNPYPYRVVAGSCPAPSVTFTAEAQLNGVWQDANGMSIPSGTQMRHSWTIRTATNCPILTRTLQPFANGVAGTVRNLTTDTGNTLGAATNGGNSAINVRMVLNASNGTPISREVNYTILPATVTPPPTPSCQTTPTVAITSAPTTAQVNQSVNVGYSINVGNNCALQAARVVVNGTETPLPTNLSGVSNHVFPTTGTYNIKIRAFNGFIWGESPTHTINVTAPPVACVTPSTNLDFPRVNEQITTTTVTLAWEGIVTNPTNCGVQSYMLQIWKNGVALINPTQTTNNFFVLTVSPGVYEFQVASRNPAGLGQLSERRPFTVVALPTSLASPVLTTSASACVGSLVSIFSSDVAGATRYAFFVADNSAMNGAATISPNLPPRSLNFDPATYGFGRTVYIQARAYNASNVASPVSNTITFTTMPQPLVAVNSTRNIIAGQSTDLTTNGAAGGAVIEWFAAQTGGNTLFTGNSYTVSPTTTTTYWVSQYISGCPASTRVSFTVNVTPASLVANPTSVNVLAAGGAASSAISSNIAWTVSTTTSWITLNTTSGNSNGTLNFNVANNTGAARNGTITVSGGGQTATINVNQAAGAVVNPPPTPSSATIIYTNANLAGISKVHLYNNKFTFIAGTNPSALLAGYPDPVRWLKANLVDETGIIAPIETTTVADNLQNGWNLSSANGKLHIARQIPTGSGYGFHMGYKTWDGANLNSETVFANANWGTWPRLSFDSNSNPLLISFAHAGYALFEHTKSGATWTSNAITGYGTHYNAMCATANNNQHYFTVTRSNTNELVMFTKNPTWQPEPITNNVLSNCDFSFLGGVPHSLFLAMDYTTLKLATKTGATWTIETVTTEADTIYHRASLVQDTNGDLLVAFQNNKLHTKVFRKTSGTWTSIYEHTTGLVNGSEVGYVLSGQAPSLLKKGADWYVVYADGLNVYAKNLSPAPPANFLDISVGATSYNTNATINFSAAGNTETFTITTNGTWTGSTNGANWATLNNVSGSGNGTSTITVAANTGAARNTDLTFIGGGITRTIRIQQAAAAIVPPPTGGLSFVPVATPFTHTVVVPNNLTVTGATLTTGDVIGVFFTRNNQLVCGGAINYSATNQALNAYGDDTQTTNVKEGFDNAEVMVWKVKKVNGTVIDFTPTYAPLDITFTHQGSFAINGLSKITNLTLVVAAPTTVTQTIEFREGVNFFGAGVEPTNPAIAAIFGVHDSKIRQIKTIDGKNYLPSLSINTIGNLVKGVGYTVIANAPFTLTITGTPINLAQTPLNLTTGWNMLAYMGDKPNRMADAFATIVSRIEIAKNEAGLPWLPSFGVNQAGPAAPGEAYMVRVSSPCTLIYPTPPTSLPAGAMRSEGNSSQTSHFILEAQTDNNATLLIKEEVLLAAGVKQGEEIAVYSPSGVLVGAATLAELNLGTPIFGQDNYNKNLGLAQDEFFTLKIYNPQTKTERSSEILFVNQGYAANAIINVDFVTFSADGGGYKNELQVYPNPIQDNKQVTFDFNIETETEVILVITDVLGRVVTQENFVAVGGNNQKTIKIDVASGMYSYQFKAGNTVKVGKLVVQ